MQHSPSHPPSPELASKLRWPAHSNLDSSSTFFLVASFEDANGGQIKSPNLAVQNGSNIFASCIFLCTNENNVFVQFLCTATIQFIIVFWPVYLAFTNIKMINDVKTFKPWTFTVHICHHSDVLSISHKPSRLSRCRSDSGQKAGKYETSRDN